MSVAKIKVALVQANIAAQGSQNLARLTDMAQHAAQAGCQLLVLPELHQSSYFCQSENPQNFDLAEEIPGKTSEQWSMCAKNNGLVIVCSLFEKRAKGIYHNTAVVFEKDGRIAGKYRKMHIPDDPGYYEKFYFTPGDLGFAPIETSIGKLGVLVCWDQWFPEAARLSALKGADLLIYPTAIGWDRLDADDEKQRQLQAWVTIQRSHAIANGLPVLSCNRNGYEAQTDNSQTGIDFWGNSLVVGPQGEILAQSDVAYQGLLIAEIDLNRTEQVRRVWPFLRDRRIDAYQDLSERYGK